MTPWREFSGALWGVGGTQEEPGDLLEFRRHSKSLWRLTTARIHRTGQSTMEEEASQREKAPLEIYRGFPSSLQPNTDQQMYVKILPEARKSLLKRIRGTVLRGSSSPNQFEWKNLL